MATVTYTVKKGDTLSSIAKKYKTTTTNLKKLNNLKTTKLHVGQKLTISGKRTRKSTKTKKSTSSNKPKIDNFGLQSDTDRTLFATWDWNKSHTDKYHVHWLYSTGNNVWFKGQEEDVEWKQSTYTAPSNATRVKFKVKPISKTHKVKKKHVHYWTGEWSNYKYYTFDNLPDVPSVPSVTIEDDTLTVKVTNVDSDAKKVQFEVIKDDKYQYLKETCKVITSTASLSCKISDGGNNYKARCRAKIKDDWSEWSNYSENVVSKPGKITKTLYCKASSSTSVLLKWTEQKNAKTYEIEYTTDKKYFEGSGEVKNITNIETTRYEITGLETGKEYFFRIRAVNDKGGSEWSRIVKAILGIKPSAPTTWSSSTTAVVGEKVILYWVHNTQDNSDLKKSTIELTINGETTTNEIIHMPSETIGEDEVDVNEKFEIDTSSYTEGVSIQWRVKTSGITDEYSDWSVKRKINIYAQPTIDIGLTDKDSNVIYTINTLPIYIKLNAEPKTQTPLSFHISVISNYSYETTDEIGNVKMVSEGEEIYSKYFDTSDYEIIVELSAGDIDLENNAEYTIIATVSMDSGLKAESKRDFQIMWSEETLIPSAEIIVDKDKLSASIRPYCEYYPYVYYEVGTSTDANGNVIYFRTGNILDPLDGVSIDNAYTSTYDDIVYITETSNPIMFCIAESEEPIREEGITLAVYRREYDGTFVLIGNNLKNTENVFVTDPHPSLDFARYRIVAISDSTGEVSYSDIKGYPIGEKAIVIQWNEEWNDFESTEDDTEKPEWSGSMLKLPYNIDVSDSNDTDVNLIQYAGRKHPVSYYGTQLGIKSSWSTDIDKQDVDTLYQLRRLAIYMGDVYVREPSGSGYWANISVSFDQKHKELTIPVKLDIRRVDGGV